MPEISACLPWRKFRDGEPNQRSGDDAERLGGFPIAAGEVRERLRHAVFGDGFFAERADGGPEAAFIDVLIERLARAEAFDDAEEHQEIHYYHNYLLLKETERYQIDVLGSMLMLVLEIKIYSIH